MMFQPETISVQECNSIIFMLCPPSWAAHIDITTCRTSGELIKLATDKDEQLQASSINNLTRIIRQELQRQNFQTPSPRRPFRAHFAEPEPDEAKESSELPSLIAGVKDSHKDDVKTTGSFPYP